MQSAMKGEKMNLKIVPPILFVFISCASPSATPGGNSAPQPVQGGDGFVEVTAYGESPADADTEAKMLMIEQAIGSLVESGSAAVDAQLQYHFVTRYSEGYVRSYQRLETTQEGSITKIRAKGQVSPSALGNALRERRREIGNPRMMILMSETMFGQRSQAGSTKSEYEFQSQMKKAGFEFIDQEQFRRILAREKNLQTGVYGNPSAEETARQAAAELNTDILVIGQSVVTDAGEVQRGTGIFSITTDIRYKLVNVGSAQILATVNEISIVADVDQNLAATTGIRKATEKLTQEVQNQIGTDWQSGGTIRVTFSGMNANEFITSDISGFLGKLRGVNQVDPRGDQGSGMVVEVRCFCGSFQLARNLLRRSFETPYIFEIADARGSTLALRQKRRLQ